VSFVGSPLSSIPENEPTVMTAARMTCCRATSASIWTAMPQLCAESSSSGLSTLFAKRELASTNAPVMLLYTSKVAGQSVTPPPTIERAVLGESLVRTIRLTADWVLASSLSTSILSSCAHAASRALSELGAWSPHALRATGSCSDAA
jgi:hypothetical protein